jgi:hypothetical protein
VDVWAGPVGTYDVAGFPAGADPSGTPAIDLHGVELSEGALVELYDIGGDADDTG